MSITFYVSAIVACLITCALGAFGMRFIFERNREIAESEDPRDSQIRDLQATLTVNQKDATINKAAAANAKEHVDFAHDRINELIAECSKAAENLDACKELLKTKIAEREELHDQTSVAEKEVFQLKERLQEVELELSMAGESGNMLDPAMQASDRTQTALPVLDSDRKRFQDQLATARNKLSEAEIEAARLKEQLQKAEEKLGNAANTPKQVSDTDKREFDEKLAGSEARLKKTENMLTAAQTQLTAAEQKLAAAQSKVSEDQAKFAAIQSKLSAAKRKLAEDEAQVAAAQKEAANKLSAAESKLAVTENRAMAAEGKLSASQNRATAAESKASEMESKLANAVGKLSSTEGKIARAESKISTLENKLSVATKAADDKLAAMTKQTAQLQQRLQAAEKKTQAPSPPAGKPLPDIERKQLQANITALKTAAATAKKQLSEAEAKRSAAESKASGYESKITAAEYMLSAAGKDAQAKLDASEKEAAELKLRLQEIDLRLNASTDTNEMTMPAKTRPNRRQLQTPIYRPDRRQSKSPGDRSANDGLDVNESGTEDSNSLFESTVEDGSPSLIQCLTEELDRWKRHAHVLGDELKQQRVQHEDDSATATAQSENTPAPQPRSATAKSNADPAAATSPDQGNGAHADEADIVDALTDIRGIGKVIAEKLNEIGIYSFERLASMTTEDRERIRATVPDFENRMKRFDYEKQAQSLHDIKYSAQSQTAGAGNIFSGLPTT